jgi:hypothetical protein
VAREAVEVIEPTGVRIEFAEVQFDVVVLEDVAEARHRRDLPGELRWQDAMLAQLLDHLAV